MRRWGSGIAAGGLGALLLAAAATLIGHAATAASFTITAGQNPANGGMNFNGATNGRLVFTVPAGAEVTMALDVGGRLPHSLQVIPQEDVPVLAVSPSELAFPGAETPNPMDGTYPGQIATIHFTATKPGTYFVICGFPGHAEAGQYATLVVSANAATKVSMTINH